MLKKSELFKKKSKFIKKKLDEYIEKQKAIAQKNINIIKNQILFNFSDDSYGNNVIKQDKNTVLLIEPRYFEQIPYLLANSYNKLGNNWNYVFYCGKSLKSTWESLLPSFIEIRPLEHDNFENTKLYSDFLKKKEIWKSLYGEFVLTLQMDTWLMSIPPYDISYFIHLNKSFIGGNMQYEWKYFSLNNTFHSDRNFNGGLSLRNRMDMIKVIEEFPPLPTKDDYSNFLTEHEDVYFTFGCIKLNLPIGDDENCSHFSLHTIFRDKYFGIHQPSTDIKKKLDITNRYLKFINPSIG
jgi:hypothetical protein